MLQLFSEVIDVQSATIPIRWCVHKITLHKLMSRGAKNPHILLEIVSENSVRFRKLAPLDQMVEYIQFRRPGENKIMATIVWTMDGKSKELWDCYMSRRGGDYSNTVFTKSGDGVLSDMKREECVEFAAMDVVVPHELFAKEPHAWEKQWVNFWFRAHSIDQCEYRKRRILAYTVQPLPVFVWLIMKLVVRFIAAVVLIIGLPIIGAPQMIRKINFRTLIHPWIYDIDDIVSIEAEDSFFVRLWDKIIDSIWHAELRNLRKQKKEQGAFEKQYQGYHQVVLCSLKSKPSSLLIPSQYKLRLRFQGLKASVCRPFAR